MKNLIVFDKINEIEKFKKMTSLSEVIEKQSRKIYGDRRFYAMMHGYPAKQYFKDLGVEMQLKHADDTVKKGRVLGGSNTLYGG